jgi:hypothetical protein
VKYVADQLGHASAQITLDRYGHLFPSEKRTSAARLEQQLGLGPAAPRRHQTEQYLAERSHTEP